MEIQEAKKMVRKSVNTPKYRPNRWKHAIQAGCYPYAIDLFQDEFFLVGDLIGKRCDSKATDEQLIDTLLEELNEIGYDVIEIEDTDEKVSSDEFKIYLQREQHTGYYHFFRQDEDDIWSHKFPNELPIREDSLENEITDPEKMLETAFLGWCFRLKKKVS